MVRRRSLASFALSLLGSTAVLDGAHAQCPPLWLGPTAAEAPQAGAALGSSVALEGDRALVGAPLSDVHGADSGAVLVFESSGGSWHELADLLVSGPAPGDRFGASVACAGDLAFVGAPGRSPSGPSSGAVFVFEHSATGVWAQIAELVAPDGGALNEFGFAIDVHGDLLAVGAPGHASDRGMAYLFRRSGTTWIPEARLLAADGTSDERFGHAIAVAQDRVLVGAPFEDEGPWIDRGSAYLFRRVAGVWSPWVHFGEDVASVNQQSGWAVDLDEVTAVVSANNGIGKIHTLSGELWSEALWMNSASSASLSGARIVAIHPQVGGALYEKSGSSWAMSLFPEVGIDLSQDDFGRSVALDGERFLVGAPGADPRWVDAGVIHAFDFEATALYCTPKPTTLPGCLAHVQAVGVPSAAHPEGFVLHAGPMPGAVQGIFLVSQGGPSSASFMGGVQCVAAPFLRSALLLSGGVAGACDGGFELTLAGIAALDPGFDVGSSYQVQAWFRDPGNTYDVALSDGLALVVCP